MYMYNTQVINTVKRVLRGHFWDKENMAFYCPVIEDFIQIELLLRGRLPLKRSSICMKSSMTGQ